MNQPNEGGAVQRSGTAHGLRDGCYLIRYAQTTGPGPSTYYYGTLRVQRDGDDVIASGDLYVQTDDPTGQVHAPSIPMEQPNPANGIPIFPIKAHRFYLEITHIVEVESPATGVTLGFRRWKLAEASVTWAGDGGFTAKLGWATAPQGYPDASEYLVGDVRDSRQALTGTWTMGWVSKYLRRAVVEIDRALNSELPIDSGHGIGWSTVFDQVGWDLTVEVSDADVVGPSGESWSDAECHAAMLELREMTDLDSEWRYHLLCIPRHASSRVDRGVMYDERTGDANRVPREGCVVCSHWPVPDEELWGLVRGMRFGQATKPYFRTAVHEISHAMGLRHPGAGEGNEIMTPTDGVASNAVDPVQFPDNFVWSHSPIDQKRLRHFPDPVVRPGGIRMLIGSEFSIVPLPLQETAKGLDLELRITELREPAPLGAPVRLDLELINLSGEPILTPSTIGLKGEFTSGTVTDDFGVAREFSPLVRCVDSHELAALGPGERIRDSLTLLRGAQGSLFPNPGFYQIVVRLKWDVETVPFEVSGNASVEVTPAVDESHAEAASKVLTTPDALLTLVLGGDHLTNGIAAIHAALGDPTLYPHFAYIEAKRLGERFRNREPDYVRVAELLGGSRCVMNAKERRKAAGMIARERLTCQPAGTVAQTLRERAALV